MNCTGCEHCVCEMHTDQPWQGETAYLCGAAGARAPTATGEETEGKVNDTSEVLRPILPKFLEGIN